MMPYNLLHFCRKFFKNFCILKKNPTISTVVILIYKVLWTRLNSALQLYIVRKLPLKAMSQQKTETNTLQTLLQTAYNESCNVDSYQCHCHHTRRHKMTNSINNFIPQKELSLDFDKTTSGQERELLAKPKEYQKMSGQPKISSISSQDELETTINFSN